MSLILPFDEKIYENGGAFIKPGGQMLFTFGTHENFAYNYCVGENYSLLNDIKYGNGFSHYVEFFEEFKRDYNFTGSRQDIDEYCTSMLTPEQLALFKIWLEKYEFSRYNLYADFMVSVLGFDKVEVVMREAITTTCPNPHVRFFNYYLMDWHIYDSSLLVYRDSSKSFEVDERPLIFSSNEERESENEINEIKSRVLLKDRPLFF